MPLDWNPYMQTINLCLLLAKNIFIHYANNFNIYIYDLPFVFATSTYHIFLFGLPVYHTIYHLVI